MGGRITMPLPTPSYEASSGKERTSPLLFVLVAAALLFLPTACGHDQQSNRHVTVPQEAGFDVTATVPSESGPAIPVPVSVRTAEGKAQIPPPVPSVLATATRPSVLPQYKGFCSSDLPWPYPPRESGNTPVPASDFV